MKQYWAQVALTKIVTVGLLADNEEEAKQIALGLSKEAGPDQWRSLTPVIVSCLEGEDHGEIRRMYPDR